MAALVPMLIMVGLGLNARGSEFADAVVSYDPGIGYVTGFTNAEACLGEPSRINPFGEPTDPFDPPYGKHQIVSIGAGGSLTVYFHTPILNHPNNVYGLDFTVFGNAGFIITNDFDLTTYGWIGVPATDGSLFAQNTGVTRVSVSRDGVSFYVLNPNIAPAVDNLFPTDGAGDFHIPVAPNITQEDFAGLTLDEIRAVYQGSAGGASFDISWAEDETGQPVFLPEISFVRIEVVSGKAEVDGLAAVALAINGAIISEDFASDPAGRGWRSQGDGSLFKWNGTNQNLDVTWDSSRTNSFFYVPLRTILTKSDDFSFSFDIRLRDIRTGISGTKTDTFEIAVGLLNSRSITNVNYFRGAGVSAAYGVRNLVEFDYFPQAGVIEATFATTVVSTNNRFGYAHNFPLEMTLGDLFRITLAYTASNQTLHTSATRNGAPFGLSPGNTLGDLVLTSQPDFRVDAFGISNYSDAIQTGTPDYWGSVLAHGVMDNVVINIPPPPLDHLGLTISNSLARVTFDSRTNWSYTLQRSVDATVWGEVGTTVAGTGGAMVFVDRNALSDHAFYRVQMERP